MTDKARIVEVFSSLQGEGIRLGERQVFVRFGGCNLHCDYCDEPETIPISSGKIWTRGHLQGVILDFQSKQSHQSVSWTGGEPLLHVSFLGPMMAWVREQELENYLETNGTLPEAFRQIVDLCDIIAMDIKLSSATSRDTLSRHLEFLRIAPQKTFVKVVLTSSSTEAEWRRVLETMTEVGSSIPLVLQPATQVTDNRDYLKSVGARKIEPLAVDIVADWLDQAKRVLEDVRVLPQQHPIWNVP